MHPYRQFRRRFLVALLLSYLVPLASFGLSWWLLPRYGPLSDNANLLIAVAAGALTGLIAIAWFYGTTGRSLEAIYQHLDAVAHNDFDWRTKIRFRGIFGILAAMLNQVSDRLQAYATSSQAEMSVIAAEANRLKNVINSINDGVVALDKDARVVLFNKAAGTISGYSIEEAAGQPVSVVLPLLRGDALVLNDWLGQLEGADLQSQQWENVRLKTKSGQIKSVDVEVLYQGADPNGIRTLVTFHDRTEAQEVEDMKVDFVALAAHELRTPITVIRGYLEILENELAATVSPEHKEIMRKLNVSASQLSGFINNILHVSRIEHGNLNLKLEPINWIDFMRAACKELANKAAVQGKQLLVQLPENLPEVAVDRMSIVEVINNLVDNAIKYSNQGTKITVTVSLNDNMVETRVADQGVGIPENAIDKLFTKFYRSHRTRTSHRGTGLGLYMSKAIVEAHGGSIWVESKAGEGSTFGFLLPIYDKLNPGHVALERNNKIIRGIHGWIKNHSLYRG
ncbi:PAS domain S-box protein [Candidatus Microgenomates bacterium]|nr:PAS domain S-box protein [Candidatus Microgenomates bacterium]